MKKEKRFLSVQSVNTRPNTNLIVVSIISPIYHRKN